MKNEFLGLRTGIYFVSDMAAARNWYAEAFGCKPYFDEPFYIGFNIAGYELGLHPKTEDAQTAENVVTYWGVNEVNEMYERLLSLGAITHEPPTNVGGEIVVASVKDPWGNCIGLIYNPEFKLP